MFIFKWFSRFFSEGNTNKHTVVKTNYSANCEQSEDLPLTLMKQTNPNTANQSQY
jgi:hypothetical protein